MEKQSEQKKKIERDHIVQEQMAISTNGKEIVTVLGSSVAVTLFDIEKKIGGMVHYLLPVWDGIGFKTLRYGNIAIQRLINKLLNLNANIENLEAKILGGASMNNSNTTFSIGLRNVKIAKEILLQNKIKITAEDIGKNLGRYVLFNGSTGKIDIRYSKK
jgi:chemotaxis protein CheD